MRRLILAWMSHIMGSRQCDMVIGQNYLFRWYLIPRNPIFNIYLHLYQSPDDDRALHDHPWASLSWLLEGYILEGMRGGRQRWIKPGDVIYRSATFAHHLTTQHAITLFFTGPRIREWGFLCPQGWRPWHKFVDPNDTGKIGPGCD